MSHGGADQRPGAGAIATWWLALTAGARRERAFPAWRPGLVSDIRDKPAVAGAAPPARR